MYIIQQGDQWNKWETLDGVRLVSGMKLRVHWSLFNHTTETIKVAKSTVGVSTPDPVSHLAKVKTVEYSFVEKEVNGVKVWVHLKGVKARVV